MPMNKMNLQGRKRFEGCTLVLLGYRLKYSKHTKHSLSVVKACFRRVYSSKTGGDLDKEDLPPPKTISAHAHYTISVVLVPVINPLLYQVHQ